MQTATITNPRTGRQIKVRTWVVDPRRILDGLKTGQYKDARDISWALLSDRQSVAKMEQQLGGEDARSNFALGIFEHALDWGLGIAVLNFIRAAAQTGNGRKLPKPFQVAASRSGDVFIIGASGRVYL